MSESETAVVRPAEPRPQGLPRFVKIMLATSALLAVVAAFAALRRARRVDLPVLAEVPAFTFRDQADRPFGIDQLRGRPFVANFIFLSCTASCPKLTERMKQLQDGIVDKRLAIQLVSITVDPENDDPPKLAAYAARHGARDEIWKFLNGKSEELDRVVVGGFKVQFEKVKPVDPNANVVTIMHGDWFVLVDGKGRIRGYYETKEPGKLETLLADAELLARYPER
jgi:protein SCO1/2